MFLSSTNGFVCFCCLLLVCCVGIIIPCFFHNMFAKEMTPGIDDLLYIQWDRAVMVLLHIIICRDSLTGT